MRKAILVVFANKQDMEQAMTPSEMANSLGLPALKDRKWQIFKTSATKGTGLDEAMEWLSIVFPEAICALFLCASICTRVVSL